MKPNGAPPIHASAAAALTAAPDSGKFSQEAENQAGLQSPHDAARHVTAGLSALNAPTEDGAVERSAAELSPVGSGDVAGMSRDVEIDEDGSEVLGVGGTDTEVASRLMQRPGLRRTIASDEVMMMTAVDALASAEGGPGGRSGSIEGVRLPADAAPGPAHAYYGAQTEAVCAPGPG